MGGQHVLGIREGATENGTVAKELLEELVARAVEPEQKRLFAIDGSKALRSAIHAGFGSQHPVQRCRTHKLRNALDHLPRDQHNPVKRVLRAAGKMEAKAGMARLRKLAEWLEREYPSAAGSMLEGLEECFTLNTLGVPPSLHRGLATTNIIENRNPAPGYGRARFAAGAMAPWSSAGWPRPSWRRKRTFGR